MSKEVSVNTRLTVDAPIAVWEDERVILPLSKLLLALLAGAWATATEIATAIAEKLEEHAEQLRTSRELMDAREAAEFLRLPYSEFKRIAPSLPRHPLTARRYVYYRSELLEWALARSEGI